MPKDVFELPDQQIAVVLPGDVVRQLKANAASAGETLRVTILKALEKAGYKVRKNDLADRRLDAARERAALYKKAKAAQREGRL